MNGPLEDDINTRPQYEVRNPEPRKMLKMRFKLIEDKKMKVLVQKILKAKENKQQLPRNLKLCPQEARSD